MGERRSRAGLYLLEFVAVLLLFSFSAAVTVRLFWQSHELSRRAEEQSFAMLAAQSLIEEQKARLGEAGFALAGGEPAKVYFDAAWNRVGDSESAAYEAAISVSRRGSGDGAPALFTLSVEITAGGRPVCDLSGSALAGGFGGGST